MPATDAYLAYRDALADLHLPAAYVDLDLLDRNVAQVRRRAAGTPVRIATKSVRSVPALRHVLAGAGPVAGLLCLTADEALHLSDHGFADLVVGYPTWEPDDLAKVAARCAEGRPITLTVDDRAQVGHIAAVARAHGAEVPLSLEVDASSDLPGLRFGVWRSPVRTPAQALALAGEIARTAGVRLEGLMCYEAQVAGLPDRTPGQGPRNLLVRRLKARSIPQVAARRAAVVEALRAAGHPLRFVNGGGTGSVETTIADPSVTEVTVGSAFYAPALFDHYDAFRHLPAAGFALRIVRRPARGVFTCLGGGYQASGAAGSDKSPQPYLPAGARLVPTEGAGETQTPIRYRGPVPLRIGDPVFLRHAKAGELCERFPALTCLRDRRPAGEWVTYRGEGRSFL